MDVEEQVLVIYYWTDTVSIVSPSPQGPCRFLATRPCCVPDSLTWISLSAPGVELQHTAASRLGNNHSTAPEDTAILNAEFILSVYERVQLLILCFLPTA